MKLFQIAMIASLAVFSMAASAQAEERLLMGTTSSSSSHYAYFAAINKIINDYVEGVSSTAVETGSTVDNLRRFSRDQIDLGMVTTNTGYQAYYGEGNYEGKPIDTRLLWVYTVAPQNVVIREDSGVKTLEGLEGVELNPGMRGSSTEVTTESVMKSLGIEPDYARGSTGDVVNSIKDGRIAGYVKSGVGDSLDGSSMDIATFTPIQLLSLTDEQADILRTEMKDISIVEIPAGGAAEGIPAYKTWAFGVAVHASPDLDEETAYKIVKAAMEHPEPQANAFAAVKNADLAEMTLRVGTVPLHAGAIRYFEEQGLEIPDHLKPTQ